MYVEDKMQRYFVKKKIDNGFVFEDSDIKHIKRVMRMNIGDEIEVVYDNKVFICEIISLDPLNVRILKEVLEGEDDLFDLTVAIGLVKEQKMDLILQKLSELGVKKIIPVNMERSIVRLDEERFKKKKARWEMICKEASEQSKRSDIPVISDIMNVKDLGSLCYDVKLVASTKERDKSLNYYLQSIDHCAKIIMVVGPEGGLSDKEEEVLCQGGFKRVSFGKLIFRVETAAIYGASIFNFYSSKR